MKVHRLIHIKLRQDALLRKIRRRKEIVKQLNKRRKRRYNIRVSREQGNINHPKSFEAIAPSDFSIGNISGIVTFLTDTDYQCRKQKYSFMKVNMNQVTKIDAFGIALMISMLNKLSFRCIHYWGTYPDNEDAKHIIVDSGFLDLVKTNLKKPSDKRNKNQIFMIGKDSVDSHRIGHAVRSAMVNLLGQESVYPPVYDDMLEISANSVEHANDNNFEKNWLVSISIEGKKLHFILADTGLGILANLKKKKYQELRDWLMKDDAEVLYGVFNKLYQSITGEINRHKGLPIIYESFTAGFVSDLIVLTNKVMVDFETNKSISMKKGFNGVLYSWTVSMNNYNNWLNSL